MSPSIIELAELVGFTPTVQRRYEWEAIEARLGTRLPIEYKEYASYFPPGAHAEIVIAHPATRDTYTGNLADQIGIWAELFAGFGRLAHSALTFYPARGGLIPWAQYESTAALCWLPRGDDPDLWPVVAFNDAGQDEGIPGSTIGALILVLRGEAGQSVFPDYLHQDLSDDPGRLVFSADVSPRAALGPEIPGA